MLVKQKRSPFEYLQKNSSHIGLKKFYLFLSVNYQLVVLVYYVQIIELVEIVDKLLDACLARCNEVQTIAHQRIVAYLLTSSLRHPKIFIKEFGDFLMPCHQHCLSVYILVQR